MQKSPQSVARRARIVLLADERVSNSKIARPLGVSRPTVIVWRARFAEDGPRALSETKPGRGRKPTITAAKIKAVVDSTTQTRPVAQTHLSCRTMAKAQGLSPATVQGSGTRTGSSRTGSRRSSSPLIRVSAKG